VKVNIALAFDGLLAARILAARLLREKGRGWLFYGIVCLTSPAWISLMVMLAPRR
jgi:hypothetical protein